MEPLLEGAESASLEIKGVWYCYQLLAILSAVKSFQGNTDAMNQTAASVIVTESLKHKILFAETIPSFTQ